MTTRKKPYHHGDLRQTLLNAAVELISSGGVENLSIRKLADQVGVSRTAPYHHFQDKNELLCAIAEQGFARQDQIMTDAKRYANGDNLAEIFETYVLNYLRFADQNRETYDLMYGREIWRAGKPTESLQAVSRHSFRIWRQWIETLFEQGMFDRNESPRRIAQAHWASLHGLCRLFNDGVYINHEERDDIARTMLRAMLRAGG